MMPPDEPPGAQQPVPDPVAALPPVWPPSQQPPPSPAQDWGITGALFEGRPPALITLGTAIEAAFKSLAKPAFILPLLVISAGIHAVVEATLLPAMGDAMTIGAGGRPVIDWGRFVGALGFSLVIGIIGGALAGIYGQVWAAAASSGPLPTTSATIELARRRGLGVLGASLLTGLLQLGAMAPMLLVVFALGTISPAIALLAAIPMVVVYLWVASRLWFTTWFAADGLPVVPSLRASWEASRGAVLRIVGWTIGYGFLFALLGGAVGIALDGVPYVGRGIGQGLVLALGFTASAALFRRTQADLHAARAVPAEDAAPGLA